MQQEYIDLYTLQKRMKEGIEGLFPFRLWVKSEITSINLKSNGHCYLELSQSNDTGILAKCKAAIWRSRYDYVVKKFRDITGINPEIGMEVLFLVQVSYHEIWGLNLTIEDVDPDFTIGAAQKQKRETIERLKAEGLIDKQKRLSLPVLPYRLSVISAIDAAGFGDFKRHVSQNPYGFKYEITLFEASMQGQTAPGAILAALQKIQEADKSYDAVLIIRGGGSELDLVCFDDYDLAVGIANCPIPVFTAIGHDKDYHIADMVAHTFVKTPTALADLFIECTGAEDERISTCETRLRLAFQNRLNTQETKLQTLYTRIIHSMERAIDAAQMRISLLEIKINAADLATTLKKGFAIAIDEDGKRINSASSVSENKKIKVLLPDGNLKCKIEKIEINGNK